MEYTRINQDEVTDSIIANAARDAHRQSVFADLHNEQFTKLENHESKLVREIVKLQQYGSEIAEKHRKHATRKIAAAGLEQDELNSYASQYLNQYLAGLEREHLSNVVAKEDLSKSVELGERSLSDKIEISPNNEITIKEQIDVLNAQLAIIEVAYEVATRHLKELDDTIE